MRCGGLMAMLGAGTSRFGFEASAPRSSKPVLSGVELAGMLAGLNEAETALAFAMYANDLDAQDLLRVYVHGAAYEMAERERWGVDADDVRLSIYHASVLSVFEFIFPERCGCCRGSGYVSAGHQCPMCRGIGKTPSSGRQRAEFIRVSHSSWHRLWQGRYADIFGYVTELHGRVDAVVMRNSR